jgi:hypothetical protein
VLRHGIIGSNKSHNTEIEGLDTKDYCFIYGLTHQNQESGCIKVFDTFSIYNQIIEGFYDKSDGKNVSLLELFKRFINDINDPKNSIVKIFTLSSIKRCATKKKATDISRSDKIGFYICYPYMIYSTNPIENEIYGYDSVKEIEKYVDKLVDLNGEIKKHTEEERVKHTLYDMFGSLEDTEMFLNTMGKDIMKTAGGNSVFGSGANFKKYNKHSVKKKKSKSKSKSKYKSKKISAKQKKTKSKKSRKK